MKNAKLYREILTVAVSSVLYGLGLSLFLIPSGVVMGGVSGIATLLNILFGLPVGVMIIALNLPLATLGIRRFGWKFMVKTLIGTLSTSAATDIIAILPLDAPSGDPLLCALFGGGLIGIGCGMLFSSGYTTGGSDLAAWLIRDTLTARKLAMVPVERLIGAIDLIVVSVSAAVSGSLTALVYSAVTVFACAKATGYVLAGSDEARMAFVFSDKWEKISSRLHDELDRGVSVADVTGWHTGEKRKLVLCAVTPKELYRLKRIVFECDERAFCVMCDAAEISGEGFGTKIS